MLNQDGLAEVRDLGWRAAARRWRYGIVDIAYVNDDGRAFLASVGGVEVLELVPVPAEDHAAELARHATATRASGQHHELSQG